MDVPYQSPNLTNFSINHFETIAGSSAPYKTLSSRWNQLIMSAYNSEEMDPSYLSMGRKKNSVSINQYCGTVERTTFFLNDANGKKDFILFSYFAETIEFG
jgi:hypothetical protein